MPSATRTDFFDLILLDIELPGSTGMELAALPGVDHVTAYSLTCVEIPTISAIPGNREHETFVFRGISQEDMAEMYTGGAVLDRTAD